MFINLPTSKEINPEYSLEGLMLKLKLLYFGHLVQRANSLERTLMLGKIEEGEKGVTEDEMVGWYHRLNEHEFKETLGNSEGQGQGHGMLQSMGSQSQTQLSDLTMNNAYIKRLS